MTDRPEPSHCDLCGAVTKCSVALLREPWSDARVTVRACNACSARGWRTIDHPAPVQIVVPAGTPLIAPLAVRREEKART